MEKQIQHEQARNLFFQTELSNQQIAELLDLSRNTITRWIKQEQWREMKHAAMQAPGAVLLELYDQLTALNRKINSREPLERFPTKDEAIIQRRLMMSIKTTERQHPGNYMQVYSELIDELKYEDPDLAKKIMAYSQNIVQRKVKRDERFNTQQYMFLEDEAEDNTPQNITPPSEGQGEALAPSCTIERNNIPYDNQPITKILPTSMVQQNSLQNETLNENIPPLTPPLAIYGEGPGVRSLNDKIEQYKKLGYEKPTDDRRGLFFAQKKYGRITIKYGRVHPNRDPGMINYFDQLWKT